MNYWGIENGVLINDWTIVVGPNIPKETEILFSEVTPKIKRRLKLNNSGLCRLTTVLTSIEEAKRIDNEKLKNIIEFANGVNRRIGLPEAEDLIIRTSKGRGGFISRREVNPLVSEPALLVIGAGREKPKFKLLTETKRKVESLEEFWEMMRGSGFVMMHDDNAGLQTDSIHGVLGKVPGGYELMARTGSLHARDMGDSSLPYPTIRAEAKEVEELLELQPIYSCTGKERAITRRNVIVRGLKTSETEMRNLMGNINKDRWIIIGAYKRIVEMFGDGAAMEFRLYPNYLPENSRRLHILDADTKF